MVSVSGETLRLALSRSSPDMPGITRSVSSTDTGSRRRISSASAPLLATRARRDSFSKILASGSTIPGSSSTTRMVGRDCPSAAAGGFARGASLLTWSIQPLSPRPRVLQPWCQPRHAPRQDLKHSKSLMMEAKGLVLNQSRLSSCHNSCLCAQDCATLARSRRSSTPPSPCPLLPLRPLWLQT